MKPKAPVPQQTSFLMPTLAEQCDSRQPLKQLADALPGATFETAFAETYSEEGRPAKPIRLMVGLLLLKQLRVNRGTQSWISVFGEVWVVPRGTKVPQPDLRKFSGSCGRWRQKPGFKRYAKWYATEQKREKTGAPARS